MKLNQDYELELLDRNSTEMMVRVEKVLKSTLGPKRELSRFISVTDRHRLLIFKIWEERHHIEVETFLPWLLKYGESLQKKAGIKRPGKGLPVKVATLTSKNAELILIERLKEFFTNSDLEQDDDSQKLEAAIELERQKAGLSLNPKTCAECESFQDYIDQYVNWMQEYRLWRLNLINKKKQTTKPYRGNPWH